MAVWLAEAEANGKVLIAVPPDMAAEVQTMIWRRKVESAAATWADTSAEVPLEDWRNAAEHANRKYRGQHRG